VLGVALSILLGLFQSPQTGTIVGSVKPTDSAKLGGTARVVLLPPKYTEIWNKQVQTRLDNYWELFKPEFAANKEHFLDFHRIAQVEALRYVTSNMRRDLGDAASKLMRDASGTGQFEFIDIPFGTYQLLVHAMVNGRELVWSKTVEVQTPIPIFVDLGQPVS
jgi:hypothetical protein